MYLEQSGLDVLIIHELGEDEEFLPQKLVCEIDLKKVNTCALFVVLPISSVCCVHYSSFNPSPCPYLPVHDAPLTFEPIDK